MELSRWVLISDSSRTPTLRTNYDHRIPVCRRHLPLEGKIRLLDVGSCYNPFLEFEEFLAIGVDISPATEVSHSQVRVPDRSGKAL